MPVKPMTKAELVSSLAAETGQDKAAVNKVLDALSAVLTKEVAAGGAVTLPNIGKFATRERAARVVRNPSTGEQIEKPADRVVKVSIAKGLKDAVN